MMSNPPLISVIMPVYNADRYVAEAVESILAQSFADFEFLIIDDGSTDRSRSILEGYAAAEPRIRLRSRTNTGYVIALNEMLGEARGELIARMDADDVSAPDRFERQVAFLNQHPEVLVVGAAVEWIDPDGDPLRVHPAIESHEGIDQFHLSRREGAISHPTAMIRRKLFAMAGPYDNSCYGAEDLDLWLKAAELGRVANLENVLLQYRFHSAKIGAAAKDRQQSSATQAVQLACTRRGLEMPPLSQGSGLQDSAAQHRVWAWWALNAGNTRSARKHAFRALFREPFRKDNWPILFCALRGR